MSEDRSDPTHTFRACVQVLKELIDPLGGVIDIRAVKLGDVTMSVLDIWGAEYQENDAMLIRPESLSVISSICARERLPFSVVGEITGSGRVTVHDRDAPPGSITPEDLELEKVSSLAPDPLLPLLPMFCSPTESPEMALRRYLAQCQTRRTISLAVRTFSSRSSSRRPWTPCPL